MIKNANITPEESIKEQLKVFIMEADTPFAESSKSAVHAICTYIKDKRVVDLGCGDGAATRPFIAKNVEVTGVDINKEKLAENPAKYTIQNDIVSYLTAQKDNSIPNIFAHHSLEHLPNPSEVLALVTKKLASGGIFYAEVPDDKVHDVHHSSFSEPLDLLPEGFTEIESGTYDNAHYLIASKP